MQRFKLTLTAFTLLAAFQLHAADKPNIVLIYGDDVGYGDLSCYGATRVQTPHLDKLAANGLKFTDGHAPSATCTPSRYAMLTGEYAWRQKGTGIARGDAAAIIKPGRVTLATILKDAGYTTAVVGKWHLGLGNGGVNWNQEIKPGPLEIGFDYCYLIPATGDRVPCVYVENHRVVDLDPKDPIEVSFGKPVGDEPTGKANPKLLKMHPSHGHDQTIINGISRIGYMTGGETARWVDEDMADRITEKAVDFIDDNKENPFFLFFSFHDIHVPRVPHDRFVGKSEMGPRGDAIVQMDWCVGEIMKTLAKHDLTDNTMVIFTSDNGPVIDDGYKDDSVKRLGNHKAAGPWRGGKYSNFEGGTRVPWIVQWPARVKAGETGSLVCQVDLPMTLAALTGVDKKVPYDATPDSFNVLPALLGESKVGREHLVEHAGGLALRVGDWKYIPASRRGRVNQSTNTELGNDPSGLLFDLSKDPGERNNVIGDNSDKAKELTELLGKIREVGRSRP